MPYKLLALDIDGTMRPHGEPRVPREVAEAVKTVQKGGVKIAIATGRGRQGIPAPMLRGIRPDYWLCADGAQLLDKNGGELFATRLTGEEMYALVDFFEDYTLPLAFSFDNGSYAYLEYEVIHQGELALGLPPSIRDGTDQDRHLENMPFSAFGYLPPKRQEQFRQKYGYLGLQFRYYGEDWCDILRAGQSKGVGLTHLLAAAGLGTAETVAVGDGENDCEILRMAGLGVCVEGGSAAAKAAADRLCPPSAELGVAALCKELWPEAFAPQTAAADPSAEKAPGSAAPAKPRVPVCAHD